MIHSTQQATRPDVNAWEPGFCYTPFCKERGFYMQRCAESPELWRIALTPGEAEWLIAAPGPLCPLCGGTLLISAPFENAMGARNSMS